MARRREKVCINNMPKLKFTTRNKDINKKDLRFYIFDFPLEKSRPSVKTLTSSSISLNTSFIA